jgi:hypothetical protein
VFCFFPLFLAARFFPAREGRPADEECPTSRTTRTGRRRVHIILLSKVVDYMYLQVHSVQFALYMNAQCVETTDCVRFTVLSKQQ